MNINDRLKLNTTPPPSKSSRLSESSLTSDTSDDSGGSTETSLSKVSTKARRCFKGYAKQSQKQDPHQLKRLIPNNQVANPPIPTKKINFSDNPTEFEIKESQNSIQSFVKTLEHNPDLLDETAQSIVLAFEFVLEAGEINFSNQSKALWEFEGRLINMINPLRLDYHITKTADFETPKQSSIYFWALEIERLITKTCSHLRELRMLVGKNKEKTQLFTNLFFNIYPHYVDLKSTTENLNPITTYNFHSKSKSEFIQYNLLIKSKNNLLNKLSQLSELVKGNHFCQRYLSTEMVINQITASDWRKEISDKYIQITSSSNEKLGDCCISEPREFAFEIMMFSKLFTHTEITQNLSLSKINALKAQNDFIQNCHAVYDEIHKFEETLVPKIFMTMDSYDLSYIAESPSGMISQVLDKPEIEPQKPLFKLHNQYLCLIESNQEAFETMMNRFEQLEKCSSTQKEPIRA